MKTKLYFLLTACAFCSSLLLMSCNKNYPNEGPSSTKNEKIISNNVQTLKLKGGEEVKIYQDFNFQAFLGHDCGDVTLHVKNLQGSYYEDWNHYGDEYDPYKIKDRIGLKGIGRVNSIEDITYSNIESIKSHYCSARVQPNYGYVAKFPTDNGVKYVRIFLKSYAFTGEVLTEITIEFQELIPE